MIKDTYNVIIIILIKHNKFTLTHCVYFQEHLGGYIVQFTQTQYKNHLPFCVSIYKIVYPEISYIILYHQTNSELKKKWLFHWLQTGLNESKTSLLIYWTKQQLFQIGK